MESITLQTGDNIITSGEILGKLQFAASAESDAVGRLLSASLYAKAEGAFTSAGNPCSLVFSTSSNDTNPTTARLRVSEDGHFAPMLNNAYDLGLSSMAFRNAYISEGVVLSDNTPASTTNKLYNNGGSLYFNGSVVGGGGGSYTAGSGLVLVGDNFNVWGGSGHFRDLDIENVSSTNVPLIIKGAPSQSANLQEWRNSSDSIVAAISPSGDLTTRDIIIGNNGSFKATLQYTGNSANRTYTLKNPGFPSTGNLDIAFINAPQTFIETNVFNGAINLRKTSASCIVFDPKTGSELTTTFETNASSRTLSWLANETASGVTKTFNICPGGLNGSITNINMGSATLGAITNIGISGNVGIGVTPTSRLHIAETWNNSGTTFTHILSNVTDTASNSASLLLNLQVDSVSQFSINKSGLISAKEITSTGISADFYKTSSSMVITESGTSRTLAAADNGKIIRCTSGSAVTITVPTGLDVGFSVTVVQEGLGQVTFSASGTNIRNRQNHTKTAGTYAVVSLIQLTTNNFFLAGDTAL